ncbi:MAG: sulfatase-like hydrolase/transferase, partial [Planctomycetota bacterium]
MSLLFFGLLLVGLVGCSGDADDSAGKEEAWTACSGLLLTLDTTRADALSCYGVYAGVTPNLDRLAEEGVLYEAAHTAVPLTLPAHASMLTGLYPLRHGVRINGAWALSPEAETLSESAREAGLQTAAFIGALVLDETFGIAQGFESFGKPTAAGSQQTSEFPERPANEVVDEAIQWLRSRDRSRRFFLWVHLFDPHWPPFAPDPLELDLPPRVKEYLGEVARMDREIGRLLKELEDQQLGRETLVFAVADHGEGLEEHFEPTHGMFCYETTMRIPMIVRYPDRYRAGERSQEMVSVVDVYPTMALAMGLTVRPGLDGINLRGGGAPADRGVYFESYEGLLSYGWGQFSGWIDVEGKYVHSSDPRFFELATDPGEERDLAATRVAELVRYRAAIEKLASLPKLDSGEAQIDPDLAEKIRSLGYVSVGAAGQEVPHPLAETGKPSPLQKLGVFRAILQATALMNRGRGGEAIPTLTEIVTEDPENMVALQRLSSCLLQVNRFKRALPLLQKLIATYPTEARYYRDLS